MALNVNRQVDDPFYRYKMPRLLAKVEGKGNGIKTVIANMPEIAKALSRPPTYPTKYFGCELGAQTQFDLKNDRYIVNGEHDAGKLQELLDGFIRKFVLCQGCDNPETTLTVNAKKNQNTIFQSCKACGHGAMITVKGRLITFICKNPPATPEEGAPDSSGKKGKGQGGKKPGNASPTEDKEDVGLAVPEDQVNGVDGGDETPEDDEWEPEDLDVCDAGPEDMTAAMKGLVFNEDLEKTIDERLDMFDHFLMKSLKDAGGKLEKMAPRSLVAEADRLDIKDKVPLLMAAALFGAEVMTQIPKAKNLLTHFTADNRRAQKYLLGGVEQLVTGEQDRKSVV